MKPTLRAGAQAGASLCRSQGTDNPETRAVIDMYASVHNFHERAVFAAIADAESQFPGMAGRSDLLADVACVALNRLAPRYVRHEVDLSFYQSERERSESEATIADAVRFAFEFVQARTAMRARG